MRALEPLIGTWRSTASGFAHPDFADLTLTGEMTLAWLFDGAFVLQTTTADRPGIPEGHCIIAAVGDAYVQHYFDSRGVVRKYDMTFDGDVWTLSRAASGPGDFDQSSRFERDGPDRWVGVIQRTEDGAWIRDFDLVYERV